MLKNPAYKGEAAFGQPAGCQSSLACGLREADLHNRGVDMRETMPQEEWITIPVPALVDPALFEAVQEQLEENRRRARIQEEGDPPLIAGLASLCQMWLCLLWAH